ncbi:hypothetical protein, partial [Klebsiella pneumoniae]|uniref:hypothetical protein n=1 Tax=Klebsiella pneumoniae TaxID=573 RepID=UPI003B58BE70
EVALGKIEIACEKVLALISRYEIQLFIEIDDVALHPHLLNANILAPPLIFIYISFFYLF